MNASTFRTNCCIVMVLALVGSASSVTRAEENLRLPRPARGVAPADQTGKGGSAASVEQNQRLDNATEQPAISDGNASTQPNPATSAVSSLDKQDNNLPADNLTTDNLMARTLKANATVNDLGSPFQNTINQWQNQNIANDLLQQQSAAMGSASDSHKGLKSHLGGAFSKFESVVGVVGSAYIPGAAVALNARRRMASDGPMLTVTAGHCPAVFDPAFQVPTRWWDELAREQAQGGELSSQWRLWLAAVEKVFQSHARDLKQTPGVAALHVIVNPDGSLLSVTPYTGIERRNSALPVNERTLAHLRDIVLSVRRFPPFPQGSTVGCYHLIFDGSGG